MKKCNETKAFDKSIVNNQCDSKQFNYEIEENSSYKLLKVRNKSFTWNLFVIKLFEKSHFMALKTLIIEWMTHDSQFCSWCQIDKIKNEQNFLYIAYCFHGLRVKKMCRDLKKGGKKGREEGGKQQASFLIKFAGKVKNLLGIFFRSSRNTNIISQNQFRTIWPNIRIPGVELHLKSVKILFSKTFNKSCPVQSGTVLSASRSRPESFRWACRRQGTGWMIAPAGWYRASSRGWRDWGMRVGGRRLSNRCWCRRGSGGNGLCGLPRGWQLWRWRRRFYSSRWGCEGRLGIVPGCVERYGVCWLALAYYKPTELHLRTWLQSWFLKAIRCIASFRAVWPT